MLQRIDKDRNKDNVRSETNQCNLEGCPGVLKGIESRDNRSCSSDRPESYRIKKEGFCRHHRGGVIEAPSLKKEVDDRGLECNQPHHGGNADERDEPERKGEGLLPFFHLPLGSEPCEAREGGHPNGNAEYSKGKFHQPVSKEEVGNASFREERGKDGVNKNVQLIDSRANETRYHQQTNPFDRRVFKIEIESEADPALEQKRNLKEKLNHPSGKDPHGQGHDRYLKGMIK